MNINTGMTDEELEHARAWAETVEPYPVKRGFLSLLDEIDRLRAMQGRATAIAKSGSSQAARDTAAVILSAATE